MAIGAFLAATYVVVECARRDVLALRNYFRIRAMIAGVVALLCGVAAALTLRSDQRQMFDRFTNRSVPLLVIGVLALAVTFLLAVRGMTRGLRVAAAIGVAALVGPGPSRRTHISAGAGASATLNWLLIWFLVAVVVVIPLIVLLLALDQRGALDEDEELSRKEDVSVPRLGDM